MTHPNPASHRLARWATLTLATALLLGCSAVKLAYNNLPELGYWWLDGYLDFNGTQTPRVRDELATLLDWHRRNELPRIGALVRKAQGLAPADLDPRQACELADEARARVLAVARQAEAAGTELALSLDGTQLAQLERKYNKVNTDYRKDWLDPGREALERKRVEQAQERFQDFYGPLDASQRELLRQQVAQSRFDPRTSDSQRRQRQQDTLALLRRLQAERPAPADARTAVRAYIGAIAEPLPGPARDYQQALLQEGCRYFAALHNTTTAAQRERAVRRLRAYETDLRDLLAGA